MNDNTLSTDTEQDNNKEYDSIAKALNEGNSEELDRLMAASGDEAPKVEEKKPEESGDDAKKEDEVPLKEEKEEEENKEDDFDKLLEDDEPPTSEKKEEKSEAAKSAASPAIDKELEQELHRLRSDAGRVPFLQRRLADLERELRAQKARSSNAGTDTSTPAKPADLSSIELDEETRKEIAAVAEYDPVVAKAIERMTKLAIHTAKAGDDRIVNTFTDSDREAEEQRFYMEQKAELTRMIPQHEAVFAMPEWRQWKATLTPGQLALAESSYASEVGQAIYAFAADMQRRSGTQQAADTQDTPANPPEKTDVSKARDKKVGAAAEVKNPAAKADEPFDEDKYFSEMYNKAGKDSHIL